MWVKYLCKKQTWDTSEGFETEIEALLALRWTKTKLLHKFIYFWKKHTSALCFFPFLFGFKEHLQKNFCGCTIPAVLHYALVLSSVLLSLTKSLQTGF